MPQGAAWEKWGAFTNLGAEDLPLPPSQNFQGSQDPRPCLLLPPPGRGAEAGPAVPFLPALGGGPVSSLASRCQGAPECPKLLLAKVAAKSTDPRALPGEGTERWLQPSFQGWSSGVG